MNLPSDISLVESLHGSGSCDSAKATDSSGKTIFVQRLASVDAMLESLSGSDDKSAAAVADFKASKVREAAAAKTSPFFLDGELRSFDGDNLWIRSFQEKSLRDLVSFKEIPDNDTLKRIAVGIIGGLKDLQKLDGRSHGNLYLSNVLAEDSKGAQLKLVDPMPQGGEDSKVDKRALGLIIYQLVNGEFVELDDSLSTVPADQDWKCLGKTGSLWKELCSDLLNPYSPLTNASWADVEEQVLSIKAAGGSGLKLAVFLVLAAGIGGGVYWTVAGSRGDGVEVVVDQALIQSQWTELLEAYFSWGGPFLQSRRDFNSPTGGDSFLNRFYDAKGAETVVVTIAQISGAGARMQRAPMEAKEQGLAVDVLSRSEADQKNIVRAHEFLLGLQDEIQSWDVYQRLRENRNDFEESGFTFGVAELDRLLGSISFEDGSLSIQRLYDLEQAVASVDQLQTNYEALKQALVRLRKQEGSEYIVKQADFIESRLSAAESDPLSHLLALADEAAALETYWRTASERLDFNSFSSVESSFLVENADAADVEDAWKQVVKAHQKLEPELVQSVRDSLSAREVQLADLERKVNELLEAGDLPAQYTGAYSRIQEAFENEIQLDLIEKNRQAVLVVLERTTQALDSLVSTAQLRWSEVNPDIMARLADLRSAPNPFQGRLGQRWNEYLVANVQPLTEESFKTPKDFINFQRVHLQYIENFSIFDLSYLQPFLSRKSPKAVGENGNLQDTVNEIWSSYLGEQSLDWVGSVEALLFSETFPSEIIDESKSRYAERLDTFGKEMEAFLSDYSGLLQNVADWRVPAGGFTNDLNRLAEGARRAEWIQLPAFDSGLKSARLIVGIESESRAEELLTVFMDEKNSPFLRFLSFERLADRATLTFRQLEQLDQPISVVESTVTSGNKDRWSESKQKIWIASFASATAERSSIAGVSNVFDVDPEMLDGDLRLIFELNTVSDLLTENQSLYLEQPQKLGELLSSLAELPDSSSNSIFGGMLEELKTVDLAIIGASLSQSEFVLNGWQIENESDASVALRWDKYRLNFNRVSGDRRDAYIAETEVSIGLFNDWMTSHKVWSKASSALPSEWDLFLTERYDPMEDYRAGMRLWTIARRGLASGGLELSGAWFVVDPGMQIAFSKVESALCPLDVLSEDLPIQHTGARLANTFADSIGMRLPAPDEWKQAATRNVDRDDRLWSAAWNDLVSTDLARELRYGSFYSEKRIESSGAGTATGAIMRPVGSGEGPFINISGNVAEYVYDSKDSTFYVVGGSSLSEVKGSWSTLYPLSGAREERRSYSDVGIRLAFDAPLKSAWEQYRAIVKSAWERI